MGHAVVHLASHMVLKYIYLPGLVGSQTCMPHCQPLKFHDLWTNKIVDGTRSLLPEAILGSSSVALEK
jgi:hypothetical protein